MSRVEDTLQELNRWYDELPGGSDRPKLLSKLAILELCGWLEWRFDELVIGASKEVGLDPKWVDDRVLRRTFGFAYPDHLRKMLCQLVGESAVLHVEATFEAEHPGRLDELKVSLDALWKSRGVLAHTHSAAPFPTQQVVNAPSWSLNQQRVLSKAIDQFEVCLKRAFARSIRVP